MENPLVSVSFEGRDVRAIGTPEDPWFIASDICKAIGILNASESVRKLDPDEKGQYLIRTLGGYQNVTAVSESGLYTLILRCRQACTPGTPAHRFRRWVTSGLIPAVRKGLTIPDSHQVTIEQTIDTDDILPLLDKPALGAPENVPSSLDRQDRIELAKMGLETIQKVADAITYLGKGL